MRFHRIDGAKDKNFWSVRVSRDIRLIVHRTAKSLLLCYAGHHDAAYCWAERRRLETHPRTGAAQLVEIRETVREIEVPRPVEADAPGEAASALSPTIFTDTPEDELLSYGVPEEWLSDVKRATEDSLLDVADHLPAEAAEALLELATGGTPSLPAVFATRYASRTLRPHRQAYAGVREPEPPAYAAPAEDPFEHPDAQRRFRVLANVEELRRALEHPWDKWTVFLHPAQRQIVERSYSRPRPCRGLGGNREDDRRSASGGSACPSTSLKLGSCWPRFPRRSLFFSRSRLRRLIGNQPRTAERIEVYSMGGSRAGASTKRTSADPRWRRRNRYAS